MDITYTAEDIEQHLKENKSCENTEITMEQRKLAAITELTTNFKHTLAASPQYAIESTQSSSSSNDAILDQLIQERDQYRQLSEMSAKMINEFMKQSEIFMDKEQWYQKNIDFFQKEQQQTSDIIQVIHDRYFGLQTEATEKISKADETVNQMIKERENETVGLRYKLKQQEVKVKSLESQIEALQAERKDLLDMCDALVAKSEVNVEKSTAITPLKVRNL